MIVFPTLPSGYTTFCDDVRHEVTGKQTLVGVYSGVMMVGEFPCFLPRLICVATLREAVTSSAPATVRVIYSSDGQDHLLGEIEQAPILGPVEADPHADFLMREMKTIFEFTPLQLTSSGVLKVRAFIGDDEIRLGALEVKLMPKSPELPEFSKVH